MSDAHSKVPPAIPYICTANTPWKPGLEGESSGGDLVDYLPPRQTPVADRVGAMTNVRVDELGSVDEIVERLVRAFLLSIAYVLPVIVPLWKLEPGQIGTLIAAGFLGQLVGALVGGAQWVDDQSE